MGSIFKVELIYWVSILRGYIMVQMKRFRTLTKRIAIGFLMLTSCHDSKTSTQNVNENPSPAVGEVKKSPDINDGLPKNEPTI